MKITMRDHVVSPHHKLDRVKLSIQRGPLGSFDREHAQRIMLLWNCADGLSEDEIRLRLS